MQDAPQSYPGEATERVGRTLRGKWRLDTLVDVGGMAAVYSATHRNGSRAAIKVLHRDRSRSEDAARRFLREGYIANAVGHPGAVRVLDDDVDEDGSVFLVMELLEGAALHERAAATGGRLAADEVVQIAEAVLDVLAAAHDRGIVHRDVKPENVFVTRDGRVKLLDFGIARCSDPGAGPLRTLNGAVLGTPAFMSPEQASGRLDLVGPQSDLWSLGATMFTLLTGELVHGTGSPTELLVAAFTRPARPLASALPQASPGLCNAVDRALEMRMADRWPDARSMRAALRARDGVSYRLAASDAPTAKGSDAIILPPPRVLASTHNWALALLAALLSFSSLLALASALTGH